MKKKYTILLTFVFLTIYLSICIWISRDVHNIIMLGMSNDSNYHEYMTEEVYQKINPVERGLTNNKSEYNSDHHKQGGVIPIHFFFISKAWITHEYEDTELAFNEDVKLTLKLVNGKWKAVNVYITP